MNTMKHSSNNSNHRRSRPRGNSGKRHNQGGGGNNRNTSYESNGPDVKVRGTAQQILEKYQTLARDATSAGDHITAEALHQFAEHYYRIVNLMEEKNAQQNNQNNSRRDQQNNSGQQKHPNQRADNSTNVDTPEAQVIVKSSLPSADVEPAPSEKADQPVQEIPIVLADKEKESVAELLVELKAEVKPKPRTRTPRAKAVPESEGGDVTPKPVKPRTRKPRVRKEEAASPEATPPVGELL